MTVFRVGPLVLQDDTGPAWWIEDATRDMPWATVKSIMPGSFGAYARVLHPARSDERPVRWAEVAAENGRTPHAAMAWTRLVGANDPWVADPQPGVWDEPPEEGSLPVPEASVLAEVLRPFTATPDRCWFGEWHGYGAADWPNRAAPTFAVPGREMGLFAGSLDGVVTSFERAPFDQRANLWWPDDRAWCVATEIDLMSTYVAGTAACVDAVLASPALETWRVGPDHDVS